MLISLGGRHCCRGRRGDVRVVTIFSSDSEPEWVTVFPFGNKTETSLRAAVGTLMKRGLIKQAANIISHSSSRHKHAALLLCKLIKHDGSSLLLSCSQRLNSSSLWCGSFIFSSAPASLKSHLRSYSGSGLHSNSLVFQCSGLTLWYILNHSLHVHRGLVCLGDQLCLLQDLWHWETLGCRDMSQVLVGHHLLHPRVARPNHHPHYAARAEAVPGLRSRVCGFLDGVCEGICLACVSRLVLTRTPVHILHDHVPQFSLPGVVVLGAFVDLNVSS